MLDDRLESRHREVRAATSCMTAERFALDTNVLVYSVDDDSAPRSRRGRARYVARAVRCERCMLSVQSVGEFYRRDPQAAVRASQPARTCGEMVVAVSRSSHRCQPMPRRRSDRLRRQQLSYWDGLMLATVGRAGCTALLSEDMQDGAVHAGVTMRNPFAGERAAGARSRRCSAEAGAARSREETVAQSFDLIVVGGGPGGYVAAIRAAQLEA